MESWHNTKLNKYLSLKSIIESNGWSVNLFAVEVGARGYCSRSVICCLKSLGLTTSLVKNISKRLSKLSMEASFCIWLSRNNREWQKSESENIKKTFKEPTIIPSPRKGTKPNIKSSSTTNSILPIGFINKGNTCYANSILQALSVFPTLWNTVPSESNNLSPLLKALILNMRTTEKSSKPLDPSNFLWALQRQISASRDSPFDVYSQQDVAEVLQPVLDELKGTSVTANDIITNILSASITCNTCQCSSIKEEPLSMLSIPMSTTIKYSLDLLLKPELLSGSNKWYCRSCMCLRESTRETTFLDSASVLIIQLKRFSNSLVKDQQVFNCFSNNPKIADLIIPITVDNVVSFFNKYDLVASINHSGSLENGHY